VRITPERPDFRVVVMPALTGLPDAPLVRQGGNQALSVYVWRQDGFSSPITITGDDLPPGVTVQPQVIHPGQKQSLMVISATTAAKPWAGAIKLLATATVGGRQLVREVRSATVSWPVPAPNVPAISRLDRSLVLAVREQGPFNLVAAVDKITVLQGDRIEIPLKLERHVKDFNATVQIVPLNLPVQGQPQPVPLGAGDKVTLAYDTKGGGANSWQPGTYSLVFRAQAVAAGAMAGGGKKANILVTAPSSPVTVTIVPKELAKVAVSNQAATVKVGGKAEIPVTVARLYDYTGEFKVELILPAGTKGISAEPATITASQDSVKLVVAAAPDAMVGARPNLTVRVTGVVNGNLPVVHEKKVNVNVVK
jgi:hypothetical protein